MNIHPISSFREQSVVDVTYGPVGIVFSLDAGNNATRSIRAV